MRLPRFTLCLCVYAICLFTSGSLFAQSAGTSGLTGTVTDPSGSAIPNATVVATNSGNNQARTAKTGGDDRLEASPRIS